MNTPKTDAVRGRGRVSIYDFYAMYDHARQLETQVQELREALEKVCQQYQNVRAAEGYPTSDSASIREARAILEKTK